MAPADGKPVAATPARPPTPTPANGTPSLPAGPAAAPPPAHARAMDDKEQQLRRELGECVMSSSWVCCVLGLGLAIPIGIKTKSYNPVVYLGLGGTLLDLLAGYSRCQRQRDALAAYQEFVKQFGPEAAATSLPAPDSAAAAREAGPRPPSAAEERPGEGVDALISAAEAARQRQQLQRERLSGGGDELQ